MLPKKKSLAAVWLLVVLCYAVPYLILDQVNAWYGSFLFWGITGILVIILNVLATRDFKDDEP